MGKPLLTLQLRAEQDVVLGRQRARQVAGLLGFAAQDQSRIATAVSEIARNAFRYAGGGVLQFEVEQAPDGEFMVVRVSDSGSGIADLPAILEGRYRSSTGMGLGIVGARRLMDRFEITSEPGRGTVVELAKKLPPDAAIGASDLARLSEALARTVVPTPLEELSRQNGELLQTLDELRARQVELQRLNRELEDTNRGVVALYAELDERLEQLRRSNALRSQFTSYLSHEFRTPLDSVIAISGLLMNRVDGDLTAEQEKQVGLVRRSAQDLLNMVDDLLDTARVESGQVAVRPGSFTVYELFNALRATLRPLLTSGRVALVLEDPASFPTLHTDEAKLSQILRNLISNALKFTESGEIRVRAEQVEPGGRARFMVSDTGVGIGSEDLGWIFEDFARVEGPEQRQVKGTGLGLPLSRKLARLLGGEVSVESTPGVGSTFTVEVPMIYVPETDGA